MIGERPRAVVRAGSCVVGWAASGCDAPASAVSSAARLVSANREVLCLLWGTDDLGLLRGAAGKARVVVGAPVARDDELRDFIRQGGELRIGERVRTPMVVVDREFALLPGRSRLLAAGSRIVSAPSVVGRLITEFETHWGEARVPTGTRLMSDQHYEVITLLASGMTDEAVARKLDVSPRTVQRHVRRVMELLGVRSRLELGVRLTRLGVL